MPGLIESTEYTAEKKKLCGSDPRCHAIFEAAEWELQCTEGEFLSFPLLPGGKLRFHRVGGMIVVFGFEEFGGERKVLLVDTWVGAPINDP